MRRLAASAIMERILYFHAAQADRRLPEVVTEWLVPLQGRGITEIHVDDVQRLLVTWVREGKTRGEWSDETTCRVRHHGTHPLLPRRPGRSTSPRGRDRMARSVAGTGDHRDPRGRRTAAARDLGSRGQDQGRVVR